MNSLPTQCRSVASNFKLIRPVHSAIRVTTSLIFLVWLFRNIVRFCDAASHSTELLAKIDRQLTAVTLL